MKQKTLCIRSLINFLPRCSSIHPFALFLSLAIIPFGARATTYYVSTTGSDGNSGTQTSPLATIQRGVNLAKPGDTVLVENGTYGPNGHYTCGDICSQNGYAAPVTFSSSGTASAPITVAAQNKWGAILDCQLPYGYSGDGTDGVQACDTYFNFQGSASYIVISGFDIQRDYWVGAMVNATNSHITFRQNHFHNIGNRVYTVPSGTSSYGIVGVYAGTGSSYITWDQNEFNNIGRLPHSTSVNDDYSHDHGLYIYNGPYTITNNIFYNQAAGWNIQTSPGSHDISILENTLIGGANPQKDGCLILWGQNTNVTIQNNIFYNGRNYAMDNYATTQSGSLFDHNLVYGSPSGIIGSIGGSIAETNNLMNVNPILTAPATNDYHLQSGSPAIDAGAAVSVTEDFDGNPRPLGAAFDIGAYEYAGNGTGSGAGSGSTPPSTPGTPSSSAEVAPQVLSIVPVNNGDQTTFTVTIADGNGSSDLAGAGVNVTGSSGSGASACWFYYNLNAGTVSVADNNGATWASVAQGSGSSISNSQCSIAGTGIGAVKSGNTVTITVTVTFNPQYFTGTKSLFVYAMDNENESSGYQNEGMWTLGSGSASTPAPPSTSSGMPPGVVSIVPVNNGSRTTFTITVADANGASDLAGVDVMVAGSSGSANACWFYYNLGTASVSLADNNGATWASVVQGSGSSISNSQCSIAGTDFGAQESGNSATITLAVTSNPQVFGGTKTLYVNAANNENESSGYLNEGKWPMP